MNKLKDQFAHVGLLLLGTETREILTVAIQRLVSIAVETLRLGWMLFCLMFLVFLWGGVAARKAANVIAQLPKTLEAQQATEKVDLVTSTKQALSSVGTNGAAFAVAQAKSQLGIKSDPETLAPETDHQTS